MNEISQILEALGQGDPHAASRLLPLVYDELRRLAAQKLAHEAAAAEAMRRILVESARRKKRVKRGGDLQRVDLQDHDVPVRLPPDEILALDEALTQLTEEDPAAAQVVQLHFFAGLSVEQAAEALGVSRATAYRQWAYARAWLRCAIGGEGDAPAW
jgi:RNA polymerase sigma factor (sigma-70 family)